MRNNFIAKIETVGFKPGNPTDAEYQTKIINVSSSVGVKSVNQLKDVMVVQALLKYALETRIDFRGESEFTTWLYRLTVNACTDEARKMRRLVDLTGLFGLAGPRAAAVQELMAERDEISGLVSREVACLRPKYRVPVLLKYVEGLSYGEIAEILGCSIGTVSSRLNRGHRLIAGKLEHLRGEI